MDLVACSRLYWSDAADEADEELDDDEEEADDDDNDEEDELSFGASVSSLASWWLPEVPVVALGQTSSW